MWGKLIGVILERHIFQFFWLILVFPRVVFPLGPKYIRWPKLYGDLENYGGVSLKVWRCSTKWYLAIISLSIDVSRLLSVLHVWRSFMGKEQNDSLRRNLKRFIRSDWIFAQYEVSFELSIDIILKTHVVLEIFLQSLLSQPRGILPRSNQNLVSRNQEMFHFIHPFPCPCQFGSNKERSPFGKVPHELQ